MNSAKFDAMRLVRDELFADSSLPLYKYRKDNNFFPVIGEGNYDAKVMFVGEAPGLNEARTGRPFCGASGKFLDTMLESISLSRNAVYITNLVKDRPPENRDPTADEIDKYSRYLFKQIDIIQPMIIATLGRYSMAYIMRKYIDEIELEPISKIHGMFFDTRVDNYPKKVLTLYHPASALYNGGMRDVLLKDFSVLKNLV